MYYSASAKPDINVFHRASVSTFLIQSGNRVKGNAMLLIARRTVNNLNSVAVSSTG